MDKYALQLNDEDIEETRYNTLQEALEALKEYEQDGWNGYQVVQVDDDGGVQAIFVNASNIPTGYNQDGQYIGH